MNSSNKIDDPRRRLLIEALALGLIGTGIPFKRSWAQQQAFSDKPLQLPPGQSIYRISGSATVNGNPATLKTSVHPGDTVETGRDSEIVFVVNGHSMLLRADSRLTLEGGGKSAGGMLVSGLRLLTGKLLSVSRNTRMQVTTATATIGIRGTGWYAEADPERTYFCTCYGSTEIAATNDPESRAQISSSYHDKPIYILAQAERGRSIQDAPWINHTNDELLLIETLVGRSPPFDSYKPQYRPPPPPPARAP